MSPKKSDKRTTISDIARETGFSTATVSRVINRTNTYYSEKTRKTIEDAIRRLNYKPDMMARGLKERRSYSIALLVPQIDEFYTGLYNRMNATAIPLGYTVILLSSQYSLTTEKHHIALIREKNYDGVIVATGLLDAGARVDELFPQTPVVMIESDRVGPNVSCVSANVDELCRQAAQHLIDNGHRQIAFISAPLRFETLEARYRGYRQALEQNGIPLDGSMVYFDDELERASYTGSYQLMRAILQRRNFSAMLVISDWAAFTAIKAAKEMSLRVPGDLSIIGFDNLPFTDFAEPPLTTVSQDRELFGETAMQLMLELIGGKPARRVVVDGSLVYRQSVTHA